MKKMIILLATFLAISTYKPTLFAQQKTKKMETEKIVNIISNIFTGTDERNWSKVENSFADKVEVDYTSMSGGTPATLSPREITTAWKAILPGYFSTHHQTGNFNLIMKEDSIEATCDGTSIHYLPNESNNNVAAVVGSYHFILKKNNKKDWKVSKMIFNAQKKEGNIHLEALAQQNVKNKVTFQHNDISTEAKIIVERFFTSLENLDVNSFMEVWADDGKQLMPFSLDNFPQQLEGKALIYNQYKGASENYVSMKFPRKYFAANNPDIVIVQFNGHIPLKTGGEYNNTYVGIFEISKGKLQQYTEYFNPYILQEVFGKSLKTIPSLAAKKRKVEFKSEGLTLAGSLHLPENFDEKKVYKGIIVTGTWMSVKEQMPDTYAKKLAEQGYVALTFDFRNYGESEGKPQNFEDPAIKSQDITSAADFLRTLPFIDKEKIGGLAVCASAGYMSLALKNGAPIKAVSYVAPWLHNAELIKPIYGGEAGIEELKSNSSAARKKFESTGQVDYVVIASATDKTAAMFGNYDYYLNPYRGAVKEWRNQFAVMAWLGWLDFDPIELANKIKTPVQLVHSQQAAVPQGAQQFYSQLSSAKNIVWIEGATQYDFYDQRPYVDEAISACDKWFKTQLH